MAFRNLTNSGKEYLATRLANELPVKFTKAKIGNGSIPLSTNPAQTTELYGFKKQVTILKTVQEQNSIKLTIQITNDGVNEGFYLKEIGIYVDDNGKEVLYWYCNEDNSQYINAQADTPLSFEVDIMMEVTNVDSVVVEWSGKDTWVNKALLKEEMAKKLDKGAVSTEYDTAAKIEAKIKEAKNTADNKLTKGSLPAGISDAKTFYDLVEKGYGAELDENLFYLNDAGTKQVGKLYFDKNKKGLFKCIKQTTGTVNSTEFFVDASPNANSDRLTNLNYFEKSYTFNSTGGYIKDANLLYTYLDTASSGVAVINKSKVPASNLPSDFSNYGGIVGFSSLYSGIGAFQLASDNKGNLYYRGIDGNGNFLPWKKII